MGSDSNNNSKAQNSSNSATLPKAYEFHEVEPKWYEEWLEKELFVATMDPDKPNFSMVIPPPNVTGVLHIGHALNNTLQDILVRYKRMDGYNTLWVPGTDHAGIATQNVVERQIAQEGLTRHDLGRDKFIERVWEWKAKSGGTIIEQLKRLGCSCDWSRERFTMDEGLSKAVVEVFVQLYEEGLIYRGDYIINWCPRCHTALADIEVEHEPHEGQIWYIRYLLAPNTTDATDKKYITVATTRPETMLGDVAVAVHPDDPRYKDLIGQELILPLVNRTIPIIADQAVDPEFGTGAVKVTPAHDFNDFEIAQRHKLEPINIFDKNAKITGAVGPYEGMDRFEAREKVIKDLESQGLLEKIEPHSLALGKCYRCSTVVEPRLSKQWFVKIEPLAAPALEAVRDGKTKIIPKSWIKTYEEWMTNIRDWCISRQIWWGHRIPAWYCKECGEINVAKSAPEKCSKCGSDKLEQEQDVLDTWFSSALWPFSTLGWPENTKELQFFYPTSVLITSFDILFFWVARMMMMGLHFMHEVPFYQVYLHALVRDAHGKKMSKSTGNVIDPLVIIDKYGTDAVRFTLAAFAAQGRDIKLAEKRIEGYRHFVNKIWNAARLVLMHLESHKELQPLKEDISGRHLAVPERWIISKLNQLIQNVRTALDNFDFDIVAKELYQFFWHEFCDWYLELAKPAFGGQEPERTSAAKDVAYTVLNYTLRLLHPIMPFVTEELWHHLPATEGYLMVAPFPKENPNWHDAQAEQEIAAVKDIVTGIRNVRSEVGIHPAAKITIIFRLHTDKAKQLLTSQAEAIKTLVRAEDLETISEDASRPEGSAAVILEDMEIFIPLKGLVDIKEELAKLAKEEEKLNKELTKSEKKLLNKNFLERAPKEIVQKEKDKVARFKAKLEKIEAHKQALKDAL